MTRAVSPTLAASNRLLDSAFWPQARAPLVVVFLSMCALLLGGWFANPAQVMPIGSERAKQSLSYFHDLEQSPDGAFRWSQPEATLFVDGFNGQTTLLTMRLAAPGVGRPQRTSLTLATASHALATVHIAPTWRRYSVLVPTNRTGETAIQLYTAPFRAVGDSRTLGIALGNFSLLPTSQPGELPIERTLFLLALPLLVWLLLWRIGANWLAFGAGVAAAVGVGFASAFPVASSYVLPTIGWPWLPTLPLGGLLLAPQLGAAAGTLARTTGRINLPLRVGIGFVSGIGALVALRSGLTPTWAWIALLLVAATALVAAIPRGTASRVMQEHTALRLVRGEYLALAALTLVALIIRCYQIDVVPFGLWRDEAKHGLLALHIWQDPTFRPVYVVQNADLPALIFYLMSPIVGVFGPHVWSVRLIPALLGALTPLGLWWATRPIIGRNGALIAAALLAWASWSISMSRWAFPATIDQLLTLLAIGCVWRAFGGGVSQKWSIALAVAGAICAGLALYGYHNGRVELIAIIVIALIRIASQRDIVRRTWLPLALAAVVGAVIVAPMAAFVTNDYEGYIRRIAKVSIFQTEDGNIHTPLAKIVQNAWRYIGMWHIAGDFNGRQHAPHAPMVDPLVGLFMLVGLGLVLLHWRKTGFAVLGVWLVLGLVPGLFSADAPHAMRSLGALAPTCALAGLAFALLLETLFAARLRLMPVLAVSGALLAASLGFNLWLYFGQMAYDPKVYGEFGGRSTMMAMIAAAPHTVHDSALQRVQVFVPSWLPDEDEAQFLTAGQTLATYDAQQLSQPLGAEAIFLVPTDQPDLRDTALRALGAGAIQAVTPTFPGTDQPVFLAYIKGAAAAQLLRVTLAGK